jgi:asparagine synthase (glutamine-hydrolysing)
MCGIAGILRFDHQPVDPNSLNCMGKALRHRGPDGNGTWICESGRIGLTHQRLAIVDPKNRANQPMQLDQHWMLVFNGEIYNHHQLRRELISEGVPFQTESDTEVLLHLYRRYGARCVDRIDGMFAFAIWDKLNQQLFAARDRFGEKPFYFHHDKSGFWFASEMKALFAAGIDQTPNPFLHGLYLTTGLLKDPSDAGASFFNLIRSLPPAHTLIVQGESIHIEQYWKLSKANPDNNPTEWIRDFDRKLNDSVSLRLAVNVTTGIGLSGGIDSSAILQHGSRLNTPIHPISAIFPGFERNEEPYIRTLAKHFVIRPEWVMPEADTLAAQFDHWLFHQEEPVSSSSAFVQYLVYQKAKEVGIKVMLEGQGADELLAGYDRYISIYLRQLLMEKKWKLFRLLKQQLNESGIQYSWGIEHLAAAFFPGWANRSLLARKINRSEVDWLNKDYRQYLHEENKKRFSISSNLDLHSALNEDLTGGRLEVLLRYADRNAMAHGIEVRLPYLDHRLVEWVHALPEDQLIAAGKSKWILRQSMKGRLPESILNRTDKIAFEPPQASWMQHPIIQNRLKESKQTLIDDKLLDPKILNRSADKLAAHAPQNIDWQILCLASCQQAMKH